MRKPYQEIIARPAMNRARAFEVIRNARRVQQWRTIFATEVIESRPPVDPDRAALVPPLKADDE